MKTINLNYNICEFLFQYFFIIILRDFLYLRSLGV